MCDGEPGIVSEFSSPSIMWTLWRARSAGFCILPIWRPSRDPSRAMPSEGNQQARLSLPIANDRFEAVYLNGMVQLKLFFNLRCLVICKLRAIVRITKASRCSIPQYLVCQIRPHPMHPAHLAALSVRSCGDHRSRSNKGPEHRDRRAVPQQRGQPSEVQRAPRPGMRGHISFLAAFPDALCRGSCGLSGTGLGTLVFLLRRPPGPLAL